MPVRAVSGGKMKKFAFALPVLAAALLVLVCGRQAFGSDIVYNNDTADQGNDNWTGNLALTFTVNSPITVDELGVFDSNFSDNITSSRTYSPGLSDLNSLAETSTGGTTSISVAIYHSSGVQIATASFKSAAS